MKTTPPLMAPQKPLFRTITTEDWRAALAAAALRKQGRAARLRAWVARVKGGVA